MHMRAISFTWYTASAYPSAKYVVTEFLISLLKSRYGRKTSKNAVLPYPVGFDEALIFSQVEIKQSVTTYFSPCIDKDNEKIRNKIGAKMNTLEAKPFD